MKTMMTAKEVAERLGVSTACLSKWRKTWEDSYEGKIKCMGPKFARKHYKEVAYKVEDVLEYEQRNS